MDFCSKQKKQKKKKKETSLLLIISKNKITKFTPFDKIFKYSQFIETILKHNWIKKPKCVAKTRLVIESFRARDRDKEMGHGGRQSARFVPADRPTGGEGACSPVLATASINDQS